MVIHKIRRNKYIQVCKLCKLEVDIIMNDKAISEQRNAHTVKSEYNNGGKRLVWFTRGLMVYDRLLLQR